MLSYNKNYKHIVLVLVIFSSFLQAANNNQNQQNPPPSNANTVSLTQQESQNIDALIKHMEKLETDFNNAKPTLTKLALGDCAQCKLFAVERTKLATSINNWFLTATAFGVIAIAEAAYLYSLLSEKFATGAESKSGEESNTKEIEEQKL